MPGGYQARESQCIFSLVARESPKIARIIYSDDMSLRQLTIVHKFFGEGADLATFPRNALNCRTEVTYRVQSVRVFCQIKIIIYLKVDNFRAMLFIISGNSWKGPPLPLLSTLT